MSLFETEIKISIGGDRELASILDQCRKMGTGGETLSFQRDEYYDTSNELLKGSDMTVRLRRVDGVTRVALKGPRMFIEEKMHKRIELEFCALDEREIRRQIAGNQLIPTAIIEKRRWSFKIFDCSVVVDQLPYLGSFLEIEGDSPAKIHATMEELGLTEDKAVRKNYTELLEDRLIEIGLPIRPNLKATFEAEEDARP